MSERRAGVVAARVPERPVLPEKRSENDERLPPDPDPRTTPGLEAGGGVPPGETPPAESSTASGAGPYRPLKRGWAKGPLVLIIVPAPAVALFFLAYAIVLNT
ncbi:DUF6480 family protein [Streptomyces sp. NPDC060048]|uniref:DUF6480 family protein n=1 Tax=unclassified Streptomyces TaxID=2593676 RepID=UPI0036C19C3C